jgi:hypothetical protein
VVSQSNHRWFSAVRRRFSSCDRNVISAQAEIHTSQLEAPSAVTRHLAWVPAFAGMTSENEIALTMAVVRRA